MAQVRNDVKMQKYCLKELHIPTDNAFDRACIGSNGLGNYPWSQKALLQFDYLSQTPALTPVQPSKMNSLWQCLITYGFGSSNTTMDLSSYSRNSFLVFNYFRVQCGWSFN